MGSAINISHILGSTPDNVVSNWSIIRLRPAKNASYHGPQCQSPLSNKAISFHSWNLRHDANCSRSLHHSTRNGALTHEAFLLIFMRSNSFSPTIILDGWVGRLRYERRSKLNISERNPNSKVSRLFTGRASPQRRQNIEVIRTPIYVTIICIVWVQIIPISRRYVRNNKLAAGVPAIKFNIWVLGSLGQGVVPDRNISASINITSLHWNQMQEQPAILKRIGI